jgi:hypothetical protein
MHMWSNVLDTETLDVVSRFHVGPERDVA